MREIYPYDAVEIVDHLIALRQESPAYNYCAYEPEFVITNIEKATEAGMMLGVIEPNKGFMIGVIGHAWYSRRIEAQEQLLYVAPEYRGGALAFKLIKRFEELCRDKGAVVLHVGASTGLEEARTVELYKRLGYSVGTPSLKKELL